MQGAVPPHGGACALLGGYSPLGQRNPPLRAGAPSTCASGGAGPQGRCARPAVCLHIQGSACPPPLRAGGANHRLDGVGAAAGQEWGAVRARVLPSHASGWPRAGPAPASRLWSRDGAVACLCCASLDCWQSLPGRRQMLHLACFLDHSGKASRGAAHAFACSIPSPPHAQRLAAKPECCVPRHVLLHSLAAMRTSNQQRDPEQLLAHRPEAMRHRAPLLQQPGCAGGGLVVRQHPIRPPSTLAAATPANV